MSAPASTSPQSPGPPGPEAAGNPWPWIAPLATLMIVGSRVPWPDSPPGTAMLPAEAYWLIGGLATTAAAVGGGIVWWWIINRRRYPLRVSAWTVPLGLAGTALWIVLAGFDSWMADLTGLARWLPERPGFDPFTRLAEPWTRAVFLACRFLILCCLVPVAEELFVRGWLARWIANPDGWWRIGLQDVGRAGILAVLAYAVAQHPMEAVAAAVWFTLVSWWMLRTGRLWDCVVIHAVTNLALGVYVLYSSQWQLW